MHVKGRNILLSAENCSVHPQDNLHQRNVKIVYYLPNCKTMLQFPDFSITKCFKSVLQEAPTTKVVCLKYSGWTRHRKSMIHFIAAAW
jgi:hypothetical protein